MARKLLSVTLIAVLALLLPFGAKTGGVIPCHDQIGVVAWLSPSVVEAAAPQLPALGANLHILTFHASGQFNASKTNLVKFPAPFDLRVLYVTAAIQAKGGTQGTTTLTVLNAGQAVTNAMDIGSPAAATVVEATLVAAQQNVAKDAAITADLVITGGTSPTIDHISLVIVVARR